MQRFVFFILFLIFDFFLHICLEFKVFRFILFCFFFAFNSLKNFFPLISISFAHLSKLKIILYMFAPILFLLLLHTTCVYLKMDFKYVRWRQLLGIASSGCNLGGVSCWRKTIGKLLNYYIL